MRHTRKLLVFAAAAVGAAGVATAGWAYWSTSGTGSASAGVGTLNPPTNVTATATPGSGTVPVSWTASTATPPAVAPTGYYVQRITGSTASPACGSSASSLVNGTSCSDTNVADGSYTYKVTAVFASWTALSGPSGSVTVTNIGPASQLVLTGSTTDLASGSTRALTATIKDAAGHTVTSGADSSRSVTFSQSTGTGSVNGLGAVNASNGVATITVTGNLAGSVTTQASATFDSGPTTSNTVAFNVTHGTASQIALTGSTSNLVSGVTRVLTATIKDAAGNTVSTGADASRSVTFAQTGGTGSVAGLAGGTPAIGGVANITVTGNVAGSVSTQATATLTSGIAQSNTLGFTVTFGTATQIVLTGSTADLASGTTRQLTATIQDAAGNTITGGTDSSRTVTFTQPSGTGTVTGLGTATASSGVATLTVTGNLAGPVNLQASATLNGAPVNSTTLGFSVTFGTATQIVLTGSTADLASGTTRQLTATIQDAAGNTITGGTDSSRTVTFTQPSGTGTVTGLGTATASSGVATLTVTGNLAGPVNLQASATVASGAKTSNTLGFNVTFGTATQIALTGTTTNLTSGTTRQLTATIKDAAGNTITGGTDSSRTVTFTQPSGTGTVTGLGTATASSGVATLTVTGNLAGPVNLQASATLNGAPVNSTTLGFSVTFGTATQIVLTGSTGNLGSGGSRILTATIQDAAGNTVTSGTDATTSITFSKTAGTGTVTGTGAVTASGGIATKTITASGVGSISIQASGTLNGSARQSNTLSFTITTGPTVSSPSTATTAKIQKGTTATVTVTGTGFQTGATVIISGTDGFTGGSYTVNTTTQITVSVTAPSGNNKKGNITVTNPDGGTVTCTNCLESTN